MKEKKWLAVGLMVAVVALTPKLLWGLENVNPAYSVQTYVSYDTSSAGPADGFAFGPDNNLYMTHMLTSGGRDGSIYRCDSDKKVERWVDGLVCPTNIIWGGGTAFGDYLYLCDKLENTNWSKGEITRVGLDGTKSGFCGDSLNQPGCLEIAPEGNYGGNLFVGSTVYDRLNKVLPSGEVHPFFSYGGKMGNGSPRGIAFDPGTNYGGLMYTAAFFADNPEWSGIFSFDTSGNPMRYLPDIVAAYGIEFDTSGFFDNHLLIYGRQDSNPISFIYDVDPSGQLTSIASGEIKDMMFGPDGALYVEEYFGGQNEVVISRIIPEPASLALLVLGAVRLLRRRKSIC